MCLSKLQGSDERMRSTSVLLSKEKRVTWSLMFLTLNPDLDLHRGEKVLAMASRFRGRLVRNLATIPTSLTACSLLRLRPRPSFSDRESELQCLDKSSMSREEEAARNSWNVSQPQEKKTTSLVITLLLQGTATPSKGRDFNDTAWKRFSEKNTIILILTFNLWTLNSNKLVQ